MCVVSRLLQEGVGEALYDEAHGARMWGGGQGNSKQKKKAFSSIFTTDTKSFIHVTRIAVMHISFYAYWLYFIYV
jgi:hypothetical protein